MPASKKKARVRNDAGSQDWEDRLKRQRPAEVLKDMEAAEAEFVRQGLPPDPTLTMWRGWALHLLARYSEALDAYAQAERLFSQQSTKVNMVQRKRGNTYLVLGRYDEALASYDAAERLRREHGLPPDPETACNRGVVFAKQGQMIEALKAWDTAERLRREQSLPEDWQIAGNRGNAFQLLGRYEDALEAYDAAESLRRAQGLPDDAGLVKNRGVVYFNLGRNAEALAAYDRAERLRQEQGLKRDPGICVNRSQIYQSTGDLRQAMLQMNEAIILYSERDQVVPRFIAAEAQELTQLLLAPDSTPSRGEPPPALAPHPPPMVDRYDVFISHRRATAGDRALALRLKLEGLGFEVFVDVDQQQHGDWRRRLLQAVSESRNLVLLLDATTLVKCADERDMLRQELEVAQQYQRKVIPVQCEDFYWYDAPALPQSIAWLPAQQSVAYSRSTSMPSSTAW